MTKAAELSKRQDADILRQDADILHFLAKVLFGAGRIEQALIAQRAAVRMKPKDTDRTEQLAAFEKATAVPGGDTGTRKY